MKDPTPASPLSPDLTVQQILDRCPQTAPFFIRRRLACVGCPMAKFDTLQDVADNYGLRLAFLLHDLEGLLESSA
jgi:hybrid cluster-associated redox disulfide protein